MRIITFMAFVICISQSACQEVIEKELIADYKIRYISYLNEFEAEAKYVTHHTDGEEEIVEVFQPKNGVSVAGEDMRYFTVEGFEDKYKLKERMPYPEEAIKFTFMDHKEQLIEQRIDFTPISNIQVEGGVVSIDSGFVLTWESEPLVPTEELLLIFDYGNEILFRTTIMGRTKSNRFLIRKEQLEALRPGEAKILLVQKIYTPYPEDSPVRGSYSMEYYHRPLTIQVR